MVEPEDIINTIYVQPEGSGLCGPYSIAHLANLTPEESIVACKAGNNWIRKIPNGMTTRQMFNALRWLDYKCEPRMRLYYKGEVLPNACLLCVRWWAPGEVAHGSGHWVYYNRGWVVCSGPSRAGIYRLSEYLKSRDGVCVSYLRVERK